MNFDSQLIADIIFYAMLITSICGGFVIIYILYQVITGNKKIKEERQKLILKLQDIPPLSINLWDKVFNIINNLEIIPDKIDYKDNQVIMYFTTNPDRKLQIIIDEESIYINIHQKILPEKINNYIKALYCYKIFN